MTLETMELIEGLLSYYLECSSNFQYLGIFTWQYHA